MHLARSIQDSKRFYYLPQYRGRGSCNSTIYGAEYKRLNTLFYSILNRMKWQIPNQRSTPRSSLCFSTINITTFKGHGLSVRARVRVTSALCAFDFMENFSVKKTHGVLYPKRTLPTVRDISLFQETRKIMNWLVDEFRTDIRMEVDKNLHLTRTKRLHPTESLPSLQMWSDSNKSAVGPYAVGLGKIVPSGGCGTENPLHSSD